VLLALWYGLVWLRHRRLPRSTWFYRGAACAGPASVVAVECGWIATEVGRQPWIVYQNMRVSEAVTATRSSTLWIMLGVVIVVYLLTFGSLLAVLLKLRTRWRLADAEGAAGHPVEPPEAGSPYGPRATVPARDAGGAAASEGDRP
jgi:cytochrome d ubiquinol oxidase subunit I